MRHKHADLMIANANDAELVIQSKTPSGDWLDLPNPMWLENSEYRIKPRKKTVYQWAYRFPSHPEWAISDYLEGHPNYDAFCHRLDFTAKEVEE